MTRLFSLFTATLLAGTTLAQQAPPLQREDERAATRRQSMEIQDVIRPVAREASRSTVQIWAGGRWVAAGTVVGDGSQVLTKWSEIALTRGAVRCVGGDGQTAEATVLGVYQDEDLALLQLDGAQFTPIEWSEEPSPSLGSFLVAAGADDTPFGIGVVAVAERVLRESDQAFLGVLIDQAHEGEGVRIESATEDGAAERAGVREGDVIEKIGEREIDSTFELRNALLNYAPGDVVRLIFDRDGRQLEIEVTLTGRPQFKGFSEPRLNAMRRMGGPISVIGSGHPFPVVLQTDMKLRPNECGGPVVDLDGKAVGLTLARVDRTRSYILPAEHVQILLGKEPDAPELAQLEGPAGRDGRIARPRVVPRGDGDLFQRPDRGVPRPRAVPMDQATAENLRRNLEDMSSLLQRWDREMAEIGE